jgi:hypothetical protein
MNRKTAAEIRRLREERERLVSGEFRLTAAHWDRLSCINLRLRAIEPRWPNPWLSWGDL